MGAIRKALGPRSKYERSIPFTYEAKVDTLAGAGSEALYEYYFSDTLCGLVELMDSLGLGPDRAELFGVFRGEALLLENSVLTDEAGRWLSRPGLCRALEAEFAATQDRRYLGHVERGSCRYEDRDRVGLGPY